MRSGSTPNEATTLDFTCALGTVITVARRAAFGTRRPRYARFVVVKYSGYVRYCRSWMVTTLGDTDLVGIVPPP